MTEEFNAFVTQRIKLHSERTGMKTGESHPFTRHSSKMAAFEAWEYQQTIIDHQQELIDVLREERDYLIDLVLGTEDRAGLLDICDNYYGPEYREDKARVEAMGMGEKYE
jgi:hypothetical protein